MQAWMSNYIKQFYTDVIIYDSLYVLTLTQAQIIYVR